MAVLIAPLCAVANTYDNEIAHFTTVGKFSKVNKTTVGLINKINTSRPFFIELRTSPAVDGFPTPRTELGRKLLEHRSKALARGMKLLTVDEINLLVNEGRGSFS